MNLAEDVYELCRSLPDNEKFGLVAQMQRAAVSIPSNIAEGHGRNSNRELVRFCSIAVGSIHELETQMELCVRVKYLSATAIVPLLDECDQISKMIYALKKSLESSE